MWIKTQYGDLCNLALAHSVKVESNGLTDDDVVWNVVAEFAVPSEDMRDVEYIAKCGTRKSAYALLNAIALRLPVEGSIDLYMPPTPTPPPVLPDPKAGHDELEF